MRSFLNAVVVVGIAVFLILVWLSVTKHTNESRLSDASEQNQPPTFYLTAGTRLTTGRFEQRRRGHSSG